MKRVYFSVLVVSLLVVSASSLSAQVQIATLLTPPNGATNVNPMVPVQFSWTSVSNEQAYYLYVGTAVGLNNVVNSGETQLTTWSAYVSPTTQYYVRMWTKVSGYWYYHDTTFSSGAGISRLTAPANGATNIDPSLPVQFTWTSVPGEQTYYLYVGTAPGLNNVVNSGETQQTSWTASVGPLSEYYVRIWTEIGGYWYYNDSTFNTGTGIARLIAPANGANGVDPTLPVQFTWNSVPTEQAYYLYVGTTPGSNNIVNSGETQQTSWRATLNGSTTFYARMWTKLNGAWKYSDSSFSTGTGIARLITPQNGATGVSQFQLLQWNTVPDALLYAITISPTAYDTFDLYSDDLIPTTSSQYPWGLQPNTYYYASICTQKVSGWTCANTNFTTGPPPPLPNRQAFYQTTRSLTSQVRLMTEGMNNISIPGSLLYQEALEHQHDPNNVTCGIYTLALLDLMAQNQVLARRRDLSLDGTSDGHVIAEYWDPFNSKWQIADSTFGLVYFDPTSEVGQGAEDVNSLLLQNNLSQIDTLFVTNYGSGVMTHYYLDPITMYNNVFPFGSNPTGDPNKIHNYVPNSPVPFLNPSSLSSQGTRGIYVFQFANQTDQITINNAGQQVTVTPMNTYGWASGVGLSSGWQITSQIPPGMNMYTFKRIMF